MGFNEASGVVLLDWLRVVKMELARGGVCRSVVLPVCPAWSVVRRRGRREEGSEEDLNALQETRKKCAGLPLASPDVLLACLVCVDLGEGGEGEGMHGLDRAERSMLANAASRPGFSEMHRSSEVARLPPSPPLPLYNKQHNHKTTSSHASSALAHAHPHRIASATTQTRT